MEFILLKQAQRELKSLPKNILIDMFALFEDLASGKKLSMPISRPLPSISKGLHELRLSDRSGEYRVFYVFKVSDSIYVLHICHKKKQTIDRKTQKLLNQRIRNLES